MSRRRRRLLRAETVAPWLTMVVVVGLWWTGASLLGRDVPGLSTSLSRGSGHGTSGARARPPLVVGAAPPDAARTSEAPGGSVADDVAPAGRDAESNGDDGARYGAAPAGDEVAELRAERPLVPVVGVGAASLRSSFHEPRGGGARRHEAMDILAPRGTPVVAAVDGRIARLFTSAAGGLTIYQFDESERYSYYYAHLDSYAADLVEGAAVTRGQILGYVGTTGNAPPDTPHLHFAIYKLSADKRWWEGDPIDPYLVLR